MFSVISTHFIILYAILNLELHRCSLTICSFILHAVAKHNRKFSLTGEGSKNQAEASITGMSLSELSPLHIHS